MVDDEDVGELDTSGMLKINERFRYETARSGVEVLVVTLNGRVGVS